MTIKVLRLRFATALVSSCAVIVPASAYADTLVQDGPSGVAQTSVPQLSDGATATSATAAPVPASAGVQATSDNEGNAGEIIVTAQKRSERLLDVPASITAITGQQLVQQGVATVQDLVKLTPGLSYVDSGRGIPVLSLRGVGFFDQSIGSRPAVSVYADEAPIPFSVESVGASLDLERVEVLKGPQGTLFGQNATGGAINYIAAKPTSVLHAGAVAEYSRFNTVDLQGYVSGPLSSDLNARIAVRTIHSDGWQKSITRYDTLGAKRFWQGRALFDWQAASQLKISLNVNGFYDGGDTQAAQFIGLKKPSSPSPVTPILNTYPAAPSDNRYADWNPGEDYRKHNGFMQGNLRIDYTVSDALTLTSLTSLSRERIRMLSDGDGTYVSNYDVPVRGSLSTVFEELRASGTLGALDYIIGANYDRDTTSETNGIIEPYSAASVSVAGSPTPIDFGQSDSNQAFDTKAVFADLTLNLSDRIRAHGGIRYTQADLDYNGCFSAQDTNTANPFTILQNATRAGYGLGPLPTFAVGQCVNLDGAGNPGRVYGTLNQHNVSWRVGLDFKPTPETLLYVSVRRGYKAGSSPAAAALNSIQYKPAVQESVLAYEAGFKGSLLNRHLDVTGAAFYYDYTDKQLLGRFLFNAVIGATPGLVNVPRSDIQGAEFQINAYPIHGLSLSAAGTYIKSRVKGDFYNYSIIGTLTNFGGSAFPYTPKWQLSFDGSYSFAVSDSLNAFFGGNVSYRTSTTAGFGSDPRLAIDGYTLVDLRAGVEAPGGRWRVQLFGRNVTNQYWWTNVQASVDNVRRYTGMPATYGVQLSVKY